jgi:AmmeMemoRadiSam system protein A
MTPLSPADQLSLLQLARAAITSAAQGSGLDLRGWSAEHDSDRLREPAAAFVTLYHDDRLRGCVGCLQPDKPLYLSVADAAVAAALQDPRFPPVAPEEVPSLKLEVSILSPFFPIQPEAVEPGVHGLMVTLGFRRGLLLPKVAVETGWDRERFLQETCLKAGLPRDAWKQGARLEAFTAFAFAEEKTAPTRR